MFLADYGDNAYQLERMGRLLDASRNRLLKDNSHLLIVSHVDAYGGEEESVINEASLREPYPCLSEGPFRYSSRMCCFLYRP